MRNMLILLLLGVYAQIKERRYSIRLSYTTDVEIPLDSIQVQGKLPEFCTIKQPVLSLEEIYSQKVCPSECKSIVVNDQLFVLDQNGYLRLYSIYNELRLNKEIFSQLDYENTTLQATANQVYLVSDRVYLVEDKDLKELPFQNYTKATIHQNSIFLEFQNGTLEEYSLIDNKPVDSHKADNIMMFQGFVIIQQNDSVIYRNTTLHVDGLQYIYVSQYFLYVVQKLQNKYNVLEYYFADNNILLNQNYSFESQIYQIYSSHNLFIIQNNIVTMTYAGMPKGLPQAISKQVFENVDKILAIKNYNEEKQIQYAEYDPVQIEDPDNDKTYQTFTQDITSSFLLSIKDQNLTLHKISNSKAYISCRPQVTGVYPTEISINFLNGLQYQHLDQSIELNVYKEIFENSNIALFVGLTIGLTMALTSAIVFCIYFYKIKHKYEQILEEETKKLYTVNLEIN